MVETMSVYIDESGNTGTNWLDQEQPFFVYGGWLINNENKEELEKLFDEWKLGRQKAGEYKANKLFKINKSRKSIEELLFNILDRNLAEPFFITMEKKFMISAKIVETFFDPAYSNCFNNQLTWPVETKRKIANVIAKNGNDIFFNEFLKLIGQDNIEIDHMRVLKGELVQVFEQVGLDEISILIKSLNDDSLNKMKNEFETIVNNEGKNFLSLTVPGLIQLFHMINLFSELNDYQGVDVFHDNLRGYETILQSISNDFFSDGRELELIGTEGRNMSNNFTKLKSFTWRESKTDTYIQLADFLNGLIQYTAKKSLEPNAKLSLLEKKIWGKLRIYKEKWLNKNDSGLKTWDLFASYNYEAKFLSLVHGKKLYNVYNLVSDIKSEFPQYISAEGEKVIEESYGV